MSSVNQKLHNNLTPSPVSEDFLHYLLRGIIPAPFLYGICGTGFGAGKTAFAGAPVYYRFPPIKRKRHYAAVICFPAGLKAQSALPPGNTPCLVYARLGIASYALGVAAPSAAQRTALEKQFRSNPRPVVNCIMLNVKNVTLHLFML